ncbi:hypothetical protein [Nonomuraea sp. B19D2]|uniref:hypothetical protein n=1 Tax=Nonomuraea sp. B19D2 TaxID=3159561 RepID=UPI0032DAA089
MQNGVAAIGEHHLVRQTLLGRQDELVAVLDLARGDLQQLLGRADGAGLQEIGRRGAGLGRELSP